VLPAGTRFMPRTTWNKFNSSCLIEAGQPAYDLVAATYYKALSARFGTARCLTCEPQQRCRTSAPWNVPDTSACPRAPRRGVQLGTCLECRYRYYSADQWNEQTPAANSTTAQLAAQSGALWRSMHASVPGATWVMQAWFLVSIAICAAYRKDPAAHPSYAYTCNNFWMQRGNESAGYSRVHAYLGAVPIGSLLMLDLEANQFPVPPARAELLSAAPQRARSGD
jgi:hypothetical protein